MAGSPAEGRPGKGSWTGTVPQRRRRAAEARTHLSLPHHTPPSPTSLQGRALAAALLGPFSNGVCPGSPARVALASAASVIEYRDGLHGNKLELGSTQERRTITSCSRSTGKRSGNAGDGTSIQ